MTWKWQMTVSECRYRGGETGAERERERERESSRVWKAKEAIAQ